MIRIFLKYAGNGRPMAALLLLFLFCGCHSNSYYQDKAAEKAREMVAEQCRDLSENELQFIKHNDPVIMVQNILGKAKTPADIVRNDDRAQINLVWQLPRTGERIMVFGVSDGRMQGWSPNRVIREKLEENFTAFDHLIAKARTFALNEMPLSVADFNFVRFNIPTVDYTEFELNDEALDPARSRDRIYQVSISWHTAQNLEERTDTDTIVVICGVAYDRPLSTWQVNFGGRFSEEFYKERLLGPVPENITVE